MMMRVVSALLVFACLAACGEGRGRTDSAAGAAATGAAADKEPGAARTTAVPAENRLPSENAGRLGRIPIFEYHVIGDSSSGMFVISRDAFRRDLQTLYDRGYRPITVAQLVARDFSDVPAGMSPVVFTFDDASPEQFSYIVRKDERTGEPKSEQDGGRKGVRESERNGELEIDPKSAIGIWLDFAKQHPDWKGRATFCLLPAGEAGHAFFGDKEKYLGQKNEWRHRKVKWLADNGFELCNHTLWHAQLSKYPDAFVQEQIARGQLAIDSVVPGYKVRTFSLPLGLWPQTKELAWRGSWTDPATKKTTRYEYETVLKVAGGPARSPFDSEFNGRELPRVIAFGNAVKETLDRMDASKTRFVWDRTAGPGR